MQRKRRWSPLDRRRRWINLQIQSGEQSRESEENRDKAKCKKEKGKKETASGADTRVHAPSDAKAYLSSVRDAREYSGGQRESFLLLFFLSINFLLDFSLISSFVYSTSSQSVSLQKKQTNAILQRYLRCSHRHSLWCSLCWVSQFLLFVFIGVLSLKERYGRRHQEDR